VRLLSIDFGTSNTVAALLVDGQAPRTVTFDTSPLLPSSVFCAADGSITVGRDAQRLARLDPARYEPNPKRRVDDGDVLLGDRVLPVVDVIAAVLRVVAVEVRRQLGGAAPDEVRLTHPAQWGATRRNVLASAARAAGLGGNLVLLPEPVAAAAQFTRLPGRTLSPGGAVAVYDLGGGTFDIAVVGRTRSAGPAAVEGGFTVLAEAGLPDLGGLDFDQAILDQVGRTASAADPARWQQILRPQDASGRRAARTLAEDVRAAKETLSRYPQTDVSLPDPFVDAHLTRTEFEGLIRPNLLRSIEVLSGTLRSAGIAPGQLSGIFLVGGSSRIPLVAGLIQDQLRVTPVTLDQPETAVALGALLVPVRRDGARTAAIADTGPAPLHGGHGLAISAGPGPGSTSRPGTAPQPTSDGGRPEQPAPRNRRRQLIAAGAAVIVLALVGVLVFVRPFGAAPSAAPTPSPVLTSGVVSSGAPPSSSSTAGTGTTASSGLGPGGLFTSGEVTFLSDNVSRLGSCTDFSSTFNDVVPSALRATRAVRCSVGEADATDLGHPVLVYVLTAADPAAATAYLTTLVQNKRQNSSGLSKSDTDTTFTASAAAGRVITAYDLPVLGKSTLDATEGASVLAWSINGRPYVGMVVSRGTSLQSDLTDYWAKNFQPRG
jgi:hypothetical protein